MFRPWDTADQITDQSIDTILETCKKRVDIAFDFFVRLGVEYYTFHDRDVAPELHDIPSTNELLDKVTEYMLEKQKLTGVKLLWVRIGFLLIIGHCLFVWTPAIRKRSCDEPRPKGVLRSRESSQNGNASIS